MPHKLVGGLAVFLHVENADSTHSSLTRDSDVMIQRADLERVIAIAADHGFRHSAGLDMLLYGETDSARNAIHLLFAGEKVKDSQLEAHPGIRPIMDAAGLITGAVEAALSEEQRSRLGHIRETE